MSGVTITNTQKVNAWNAKVQEEQQWKLGGWKKAFNCFWGEGEGSIPREATPGWHSDFWNAERK